MGMTVAVDTDHLRASARTMAEAKDDRRGAAIDAHDLGSWQSTGALERFGDYWEQGRSALGSSLDAFEHILRSSADAYERRDAEGAKSFEGTVRAI